MLTIFLTKTTWPKISDDVWAALWTTVSGFESLPPSQARPNQPHPLMFWALPRVYTLAERKASDTAGAIQEKAKDFWAFLRGGTSANVTRKCHSASESKRHRPPIGRSNGAAAFSRPRNRSWKGELE